MLDVVAHELAGDLVRTIQTINILAYIQAGGNDLSLALSDDPHRDMFMESLPSTERAIQISSCSLCHNDFCLACPFTERVLA